MQREILGASRYKLYKKGEPITSFIDNGRVLTLKELYDRLGGVAKPDITKLSKHVQERMSERDVLLDDVKEAIANPLFTENVREKDGAYRIVGEKATVGVSAFDGRITTAWHTGKNDLKKYGDKDENT